MFDITAGLTTFVVLTTGFMTLMVAYSLATCIERLKEKWIVKVKF